MDYLTNFLHQAGNWSYVIVFIIIFLESFPFTFFLPGDSLLFMTGFLASKGDFKFWALIVGLYVSATLGYYLSYLVGERVRVFILNSNDKYWFKKKHLDYTHEFFEKYGAKTVIIGRFVPIVRSFSPALAGAVDLDHKKFLKYNIIGGAFWTVGMTSLGYYLGTIFPKAHLYLEPIVVMIIFISLLPTIVEYWTSRRNKTQKING